MKTLEYYVVLSLINIVLGSSEKLYEIQRLNGSSGIYFERLYQLHWKQTEWSIYITIEVEKLLKDHEPWLNRSILDVCREKFIGNYCDNVMDLEEIQNLNRSINNHQYEIRDMMEDLKIKNISTTNPDTIRSKRMVPLGIVGMASRTLFGTATLKDVEDITKKLDDIGKEQSQIVHINSEQIHLITQKFEDLDNITKTQRIMLKEFEDQFLAVTKNNQRVSEVAYANDLMLHARIVANHMRHVKEVYQRIGKILKGAVIGKIKPELLQKDLLQQMGDDIRRTTNGADFPILNEHLRAETIAQISNIDVVYHKDKLIVIVKVPLVNKEPYQLYQINELPVRQTSINKHISWAHIRPKHEYIAVSSDNRQFVELNKEDLNSCTKIQTGKLCNNNKPTRMSVKSDGCEINMLLQPSTKIMQTCDVRISRNRENYWKYLQQEAAWLFSMEKEETMTISCSTGKREIVNVNGTGIIRLADGCVGHTPTVAIGGSNTNANYTTFTYHPRINLDVFEIFPKLKDVTQYNLPKLRHIGEMTNWNRHSLNDLAEELERDDQERNSHQVTKYASYGSYMTQIMIIIGLILLIVRKLETQEKKMYKELNINVRESEKEEQTRAGDSEQDSKV